MLARLTIIGLYNYDNTILDDFKIDGIMERDTLRDRLFMECSDFTMIYPDPDLFKTLVKTWSISKYPLWKRIYDAAHVEYDLLHNYDRTETESISRAGEKTTRDTDVTTRADSATVTDSGTRTSNSTDTTTIDRDVAGTNTGTETVSMTGGKTDTRSVTGFNSGTLQVAEENKKGGTDTDIRTDNLANTTTEDITEDRSQTGTDTVQSTQTHVQNGRIESNATGSVTDSGTENRTVRAYGNIGVTTNQQMLEAELALIPDLDIYNHVVNDFINAFCVAIY